MRTPAFWNRQPPTPTARALSPLGKLYGAATARRMGRPGARAGAPVICVGNFVAGGAGKTPTALTVARMLLHAGERVAFLSRGYGGAARSEPLRVDPASHSAATVGDEPLLLARVAPCYVGVDRVASAAAAVEGGASVLVMDDGLQNPSLIKDLALAVVDGDAHFGNGLCVPAGPLRAPLAEQSRHIHAIVVIGGYADALGPVYDAAPGKPLFRARLQPDAVAAAGLIGRAVLAFAGIARPEKFFATLSGIGARVAIARPFADHHVFTAREIEALLGTAEREGLIPVTTEKDAARLPPRYRAAVATLPVTLGFDDAADFAALLASALPAPRRLSP